MILNKDYPGGNYNHVLVIKDFSKYKRGQIIWANIDCVCNYDYSIYVNALDSLSGEQLDSNFDLKKHLKLLNNTYWRTGHGDPIHKFLKIKTGALSAMDHVSRYKIVRYFKDQKSIIDSDIGEHYNLLKHIFEHSTWLEK